MKQPRLKIKSVGFHTDYDAGTYQATVCLSMDLQEFQGIQEGSTNEPKSNLIALATFSAVKQALEHVSGISAHFNLKVAAQLWPNFLDNPLFIVIVEASANNNIAITSAGALMTQNTDYCRAFAAASMDAINRFTSRLLIAK